MSDMLERNKQILLVEDEEALVFGLQKLLQTPVIEVDTARTFDEAVSRIDAKPYDAVITDLNLSHENALEGLEVIRMTKALQPGCKLIAITAFGEDPLGERVRAMGADYYVEKPVPPRAIKELLHSLGFHYVESTMQF
jgi:DNA-binding response OmpR family regulator